MSAPAFTPGPWRVATAHDRKLTVQAPAGWNIASLCGSTAVGDVRQRMEANARLIAAAPELYEACEAIAEALGFTDGCDCGGAETCASCKVLSALAAARGEP